MNKDTKNKKSLIASWSERSTAWIGSPLSLITHTVMFAAFFLWGFFSHSWDRILLVLTTIVSLEAIYLAIFIQMTVNRNTESLTEVEEDIDEIQEDIDEIQEDVEEIQEDVEVIQEDVDVIHDEVDELSDEEERSGSEKSDSKIALEKIYSTLERLSSDIDALKKEIDRS
jgi:uncharacterized protein YoxC